MPGARVPGCRSRKSPRTRNGAGVGRINFRPTPASRFGPSNGLLGEAGRRLDVLPALAAEGLEEGDEVLLLPVGEVQRLHALVDVGVADAPLVVVIDDLFE